MSKSPPNESFVINHPHHFVYMQFTRFARYVDRHANFSWGV